MSIVKIADLLDLGACPYGPSQLLTLYPDGNVIMHPDTAQAMLDLGVPLLWTLQLMTPIQKSEIITAWFNRGIGGVDLDWIDAVRSEINAPSASADVLAKQLQTLRKDKYLAEIDRLHISLGFAACRFSMGMFNSRRGQIQSNGELLAITLCDIEMIRDSKTVSAVKLEQAQEMFTIFDRDGDPNIAGL